MAFNKKYFLLFLFVVLNVALITSYLYKENGTGDRDFTKRLIYQWTESDAFLDDIYTFNVRGIADSLTRLLSVYDNHDYKDICIVLSLSSFSGSATENEEVCTNGATVSSIVNHDSSENIYVFDIPINIGNKSLGSMKIYEKNEIVNAPIFHHFSFFISLLLMSAFSIYSFLNLYRTKAENNVVIVEPDLDSHENECEKKFSILSKVISNNKQHFALNDDIVFATYEHPYTNLFYKNGNTLAIRCSLLDLESLSVVDFMRLNKSSIVNSSFLKQEKVISFRRDQSLVTVRIKKKEHDIVVSPVYKENIF